LRKNNWIRTYRLEHRDLKQTETHWKIEEKKRKKEKKETAEKQLDWKIKE
jgi:hypothetical protein